MARYSGIYLHYEGTTAQCDSKQQPRETVFDTDSGLFRYKRANNDIVYLSTEPDNSGAFIAGTSGYLAKFGAGGDNIGDSLIYDDGAGIGIGTTDPSGKLDVRGTIYQTEDISGSAFSASEIYAYGDESGYIDRNYYVAGGTRSAPEDFDTCDEFVLHSENYNIRFDGSYEPAGKVETVIDGLCGCWLNGASWIWSTRQQYGTYEQLMKLHTDGIELYKHTTIDSYLTVNDTTYINGRLEQKGTGYPNIYIKYDAGSYMSINVADDSYATFGTAESGGFRFKPITTNSTDFFQVQDQAGTSIFNIDTVNDQVDVSGTLNIGTVAAEGETATKILTLDSSDNVDYRTPEELAIDGGAGINWTSASGEDNGWESLTYGNGLFVAVSYGGDNSAMTSPDGINWTARAHSENNYWTSVTYGNGLFVAVSTNGTDLVMTSPDGINWTDRAHASGEDNQWMSVTYGNGLFVAVSNDGTNRVMTSPDGINWTARAQSEDNQWMSVTYGNGLFVAVAFNGNNRVMTSPDGINWTARSHASGEDNEWQSVTYGNGLFVAVSNDGNNRVMTSPDGINWTARAHSEDNYWTSVTYGNGLFVAVSNDGNNRVMTSPDGINWTARAHASGADNNWYAVTYGNGLFVAVANDSTNNVMISKFTDRNITVPDHSHYTFLHDVGIGTATPSGTLDVNGDITLVAGSGSYYSSDGSQGVTTTFTNGDGDEVTVKDGIITAVSAV